MIEVNKTTQFEFKATTMIDKKEAVFNFTVSAESEADGRSKLIVMLTQMLEALKQSQ